MTEAAALSQPSILDIDPFEEAFLANPYPGHEILREAGPVVRLSRYGVVGMARYAEVSSALRDWKTFCSGRGVGVTDLATEPGWRSPSLLLEADPPLHDRMRGIFNPLVDPPTLARLRETWKPVAEALADRLVEQGDFDAVTDLGEVFPLQVFPDAVGLPREGRENLLRYGFLVFNSFGPRNRVLEDSLASSGPVVEWVQESCRRSSIAPDSFGQGVFEAVDRGALEEEEGERLIRTFISAGVDTTVIGISAMLSAFAANPDQWALVKADRSLVRPAFEEVLRWASPIQTFFRTTTRDVEVDGVSIGEGQKVLLFMGAANRDPRRWDDPERFDVRRKTRGHVALGLGIHACLGQMIARLEAELVLTALLDRVDRLELTGLVVLRPNNTVRSVGSVPVRIWAA